MGRLAVGGRQPIGYYKDPEKSARTFITVDGKRYSCPGDYAVLEEDGKVTVLGRGSVCINTGGEKVYPEEVEEALKLIERSSEKAVSPELLKETLQVLPLHPVQRPDG